MATTAAEDTEFTGFPERGLAFLEGLEANNDKTWFDGHRDDYDEGLMVPAKSFVVALGERLRAQVGPGIHAEPRVNGSIFRINRDIRFSADKTPYKTHLDMFFWEGEGKGRECPGLWMRIAPGRVHLGAGMPTFSKPALARFRDAVVDDAPGERLARIVADLRDAGAWVQEPRYARVPRGYEAEGARAELIRLDGITAGREHHRPDEVGSAAFVDWCADGLERYVPLHRWLVEVIRP